MAVIGAGLCGLAAARCLLEAGLEPVVFERSGDLGGLWNFSEQLPSGGTVAYRSLRTNTSKQMTAFSDFPFPADAPDFPSRAQVLDYLHAYAEHFSLRSRVRLLTEVEAVAPAASGGWGVRARPVNATPGQASEERFDAVVIASGFYSKPWRPNWPGVDGFSGQLLHSALYKGPEPFAGQRVVVVGTGSSAADLAVEISRLAPGLLLSTRHGAWVLPRYMGGRPTDHLSSRFVVHLPRTLRQRVTLNRILAEYRRLGLDPARWLPLPEFDLRRIRLTAGVELLQQLQAGAILARPAIERLEPDGVVFVDGTRALADVVLACTGYHLSLPFLAPGCVEATSDALWLYRHVFPPETPGLAFIGFCVVGAAAPPTVEMQSRWVAQVFAGRTELPPVNEMRNSVARHRARCRAEHLNPMRLNMPAYIDELAGFIGAQPRLWRHPRLLLKLLFGPMVAAQYRLDGPGRSDVAERTLRQATSR